MNIDILPTTDTQAQGVRIEEHRSAHPTPFAIMNCVMDALHDAHESGQHVPMHIFPTIRKAFAKANADYDAGETS